ncbi:MerR family transcriptional regulator [Saccharibacillus kuerlensis]|uniref:HTH merR-type domain-containing protein n=1 Tax=Saccharibacillus kuerlensis TaxID=459527 RepID=A0ABQ2KSA3_9BACL|nr:MerR family transcriptional regulator [Saccharibacillus kuerlensis]GGN91802.1 hypothetical protein GCM10010969_03620 [Saccharibacillus kuerlensis]
MSDFLSISEFAGMMGVSVHQIRYFEEKGLLQPSYIEPNGYRRYGVDEMYRLAHILLLRQLNVPVAETGRAIDRYGADECESLLRHSLDKVREEIGRLQRLEHFTAELLEERKRKRGSQVKGELQRRPSRYLRRWVKLEQSAAGPTARSLFEALQRPGNMFETDLFYVRDGGETALYFEIDSGEPGKTGDLLLEEGLYWCEHFASAEDEETERRIEEACRQVADRFGFEAELLVLREKSYLSLFDGEAVRLELEIRIGDLPESEGRGDY